jgi:GT2 family glycosyltransferase
MKIKASIIILNYNGERFIEKLFLSLNAQSFKQFEIVFVDNASKDNSIKILNNMLKKEVFKGLLVKIIINKENLGYCAGNNVGLMQASSKYVVFLNNDVFVDSFWLENLVNSLDADPSVGACQSLILSAKTKEVQSAGMLFDVYGWSLGIHDTKNVTEDNVFYPMGTSAIVRKNILDSFGGFDASIFSGDYDLGWKIRLSGYRIISSLNSKCHHFGSYATNALYIHSDQYYEACRERIYVLAKNYSLSRIVLRIPTSIMLMFLASTAWSIRTRNNYLISVLRALKWNLRNLKMLSVKRGETQKHRKITDNKIEKSMSKYPLMILLSKI